MLDTLARVSGHVKWFDLTRGFGFIVSEDGGPDILLHANVLRNFGQGSVAEMARIEAIAQQTQKGLQVTEITRIEPPPPGRAPEPATMVDLPEIGVDVPFEPVRVKWFDKVKGFGFANRFGDGSDIFVHMEVLRRSGLSDLAPGEAVALRVANGPRGLMAVEVASWDSIRS